MSSEIKELRRKIWDFYVTSTGRLSYPMCKELRDVEYPALLEELKRLRPDAEEVSDPDLARLKEALGHLEVQLERYEAINRRWNQGVHPPELRQRLA
jgi:hypothetical protein